MAFLGWLCLSSTGPASCATLTASQRSVNTTVGGNITLPCLFSTDTPRSDLFIQWIFYNAKVKKNTIVRGHVLSFFRFCFQTDRIELLDGRISTQMQQSPCHSVSYKSASHCQKMVYLTDARGRCSWKNKVRQWCNLLLVNRNFEITLMEALVNPNFQFPEDFFSIRNGQLYTSAEYKNRIHVANSTGNASLTIFNMQPWETGVYTCEVLGTPSAQVEKSFPVYVLNPETGLLVIGNLTKFEEGYYQCIAKNPLGNSTCQIDLTIKHSESGIIAAALIAAILAAALICVIVWVLTSKEKKKKRNEKAAISEMQTMAQKEPLTADYATVPSQENVPVAAVPPSKDSNETGEYVTPDEIEGAAVPENERQEMGHQPEA
ncbi:hypothetical protein JD844_004323 [Phrynosoma platyrhinos]|uniref:Immunoglobulin domain-containing protein n=1 Tax=Phrynosoma platyrhinos TaxID=52577 RepID=A0ABQ7TML9_PHRPL|nr:hypothetical protein JD844_004323 [Phrynosoma platyrhinos]